MAEEEFSGSRRKFLGWFIGGITGVIAVGYSVPLLSYLLKPALAKREEPWSEVGSVASLKPMQPRTYTFQSFVKIGWEEKKVEHDVWVVKHPDGKLEVFSPICPHLGCGYHWNAGQNRFECPCHLSMFDIHGNVLGGPAPRALDLLPYRLEGERLFVKYESFRLGVPEKMEA